MTTFKKHRYLLATTDPVHIGTGGYRLGRVDNSIVREPGTRIPKIPGTSLHGAIRSYAAKIYEDPQAAGQDQTNAIITPDKNPICYTFGYIQSGDNNERAFSGVVNIFDAVIFLFPVHSMSGPVWVTTSQRLQEAGITINDGLDQWADDTVLTTFTRTDALNLGWIMLEVSRKVTVSLPDNVDWGTTSQWRAIQDRLVLVKPYLFSQIVNSNLEIRTSVSIEPKTGAAKSGALFTYEALPRSTFLTMDIVLDDYREGESERPFPVKETAQKNRMPNGDWTGPEDVVQAGLNMLAWLGVGGMGTRGFGRLMKVGSTQSLE